jgi:hypothetical protein
MDLIEGVKGKLAVMTVGVKGELVSSVTDGGGGGGLFAARRYQVIV